ncbi:Fic family protein [Bradyrhizobium sp. 153]|uniref:Fic family protein n=1 Tax=Bradyrhizobium sp. 153 TaxID=2782627 RepID=UPI001FFAB4CC|nr:Fic family protein [Bradyrhizobium sp. 153]
MRLHHIVIGDERFVKLGFRKEGGFVGEHDHETQRPIPDHISAHHEDIASLVHGLIAFDQASSIELDPVVAAAVLAFEFVYIHPFEDGNGRTWYDGFNPPASTFRFSAAILRQNRRTRSFCTNACRGPSNRIFRRKSGSCGASIHSGRASKT